VGEDEEPGLTADLCIDRATYCRQLIGTTEIERVKVMLEHIALTWERIAQRVTEHERTRATRL
jgi:hypothetical protein